MYIHMPVTNHSGRLVTGVASDALAKWLSLPVFIFLGTVGMLCGHLLLCIDQGHLGLAVPIVGASYGSLFACMPAYLRIFGFASVALAIGNITMSHISGVWADSHTQHGTEECVGTACFRDTFKLFVIVDSVGILAAGALFVYARMHRSPHTRVKGTMCRGKKEIEEK
jgi:hypothetical protein